MYGLERQGLPVRAVVCAALGAVLLGALSLLGVDVVPIVGLAALTVVAWRTPAAILALFLCAGAFKRHTLVAALFPADPTVVLATLLGVVVVLRVYRQGLHVPRALVLLLPILVVVTTGAWGAASTYGAEKALRFGTLTVLAVIGTLALLRRRSDFQQFLTTVGVVAVGVTVLATLAQQTDSMARLRMDGTSPITLARMSIITLAFSWLTWRLAATVRVRQVFLALVSLLAVYVVIATGSRGPVLSLVVGLALIEWAAHRYHGRSMVNWRWLPFLAVAIVVLVLSGVIPAAPLERFQQAITLAGDRSIDQRLELYRGSATLLVQHPFGIGVGGFAEHAILQLRYPHNVFLEVGVELGWVPMLALLALVVWSGVVLFQILRRTCDVTTHLMVVLVVVSGVNAMVTGDLNDNRMFFALLVTPFLYHSALRPRLESRETAVPTAAHAMHLASSR